MTNKFETYWEEISVEDLKSYLKAYPRKLSHNFFMDVHSWYDFSKGKTSSDEATWVGQLHPGYPGLPDRAYKKRVKT